MLITSLDNDKIKDYAKLKERKYRKETGTFIAEGMHLVLEAYKSGIIKELIIEQDSVLPFDVPTLYVTKEILAKLTSLETPPEVMALCNMLEEKEEFGNKVLLLDSIQDPGNLGTILRSAVAFNVDTVVLSPDTVDLYNYKVLRATQGIMFHINVIVKDLKEVISNLKEQEIPVYGTRLEYGEDVRRIPEKDKTRYALVMGNEGQGVKEEIKELCDKFLYIDMSTHAESLNVSIATSIILYELNR